MTDILNVDSPDSQVIQLQLTEESAGLRLDRALAKQLNDYSRSRIQQWIKSGCIRVDGEVPASRQIVKGNERVRVEIPDQQEVTDQAEAQPLDILFEDESLLVLNKPAGLVVHPGAGNRSGTLLNALLHHVPDIDRVPRAGIVHRLDKETTGLMVVAKTIPAQTRLVEALQARDIKRHYKALVHGRVVAGKTIDAAIGRHAKNRIQMAVRPDGREARTQYRVAKRFAAQTLLNVQLDTGRTHQIRVHMAHIRYPIVGDPVYGGPLRLPKGTTVEVREALSGFRRQALHAYELTLMHPLTQKEMSWQAPLPEDFSALVAVLAAAQQDTL